jgi:FkbM family methyltransferase
VNPYDRWDVWPFNIGRIRAMRELASELATRNRTLAANLENAASTIEHLRRVEGAYFKAAERIDELEASLQEAIAAQTSALESAGQLTAQNSALTSMNSALTSAINELRRTEAACREAAALAEATARRGVQAMMNEWQRMLFEVEGNTGPSEAATTLVLADQPVEDSLATLINLSEDSHGARPFQYAAPILAARRPFPLSWREDLPPLRVVDVGSQELSSENDVYAPLRAVAPVEIIGFDPFAPSAAAGAGVPAPVDVTRSDGSRIKTFPILLADGGTVTFHINRYDPTSSILASNHRLTKQFGLLDLALETVETRTLPSYRMDDVLPVEGDQERVDLLKIDVQGAAHTLLQNAMKLLRKTLVCHIEVEFAPVYLAEKLFGDIDNLLRGAGFCFVDFFSLGRQRYGSFDASPERAFHRGRTLWADCIYIRDLDTQDALTADDLFRAAVIVHSCYNKQDLAAELLGRIDGIAGTALLKDYIKAVTVNGQTA